MTEKGKKVNLIEQQDKIIKKSMNNINRMKPQPSKPVPTTTTSTNTTSTQTSSNQQSQSTQTEK